MRFFKHSILGVFNKPPGREPWSPPGVSLTAARRMWPESMGENTVVAVLDTGVDYKHPDLADNVAGGISLVAGEKDFMDENGHGTHVAGTIAANKSILGVAPRTKILVVKVLNKNGQGSYQGIADGIEWASKWKGKRGEKVNVINMSLGGPMSAAYLHKQIKKALKAGITMVCAAGNEGDGKPESREISYPAYYKETLAVGAIDLQIGIANFSNSNNRIDVVAPGVDTYSTYPGGKYVKLSGTSMAAPHISGAVALIYSRYKKRFNKYPSSGLVRSFLHYYSTDLGTAGFDELYGYGMFTFNPDGGKVVRIIGGNQKYYVNNKEYEFSVAPVFGNGENDNGSPFNELVNHLGCDCEFIPANKKEGRKGELSIWC